MHALAVRKIINRLIQGLKVDLRQFGRPHFNSKDHPAYLTVMLSLPQISPLCHPEYFHIFQLGVYMELVLYRGVIFSGCQKHTGTTPTTSSNNKYIQQSNFCINLVYYPTKHCVDSTARYVFGSSAGKPLDVN